MVNFFEKIFYVQVVQDACLTGVVLRCSQGVHFEPPDLNFFFYFLYNIKKKNCFESLQYKFAHPHLEPDPFFSCLFLSFFHSESVLIVFWYTFWRDCFTESVCVGLYMDMIRIQSM